MYFVRNGGLSAYHEVADEIEVTKQFFEGSHFGEFSFFDADGVREISVRADTHCLLEELSYEHLAELVAMYDDIAGRVQIFAEQHKVDMDREQLQEHAKDNFGQPFQSPATSARSLSRRSPRDEPSSGRRPSWQIASSTTVRLAFVQGD